MSSSAEAGAPAEPAGWELRQKIGLVLGPVLFLAVALLLKNTHLTDAQRWAAATVVFMATWWITEPIPLWVTALLPIPIYPLLCKLSLKPLLLQYCDGIIALFIGGMLIAAAMQEWGLHRRIALGIVSLIGASPHRIVLGFMLATGFITLWISNTAAAMMMFPIGMAVIKKFEEQYGKQDPLLSRFGLALMLGIAYSASVGGVGTKIGTPPNLVFVKIAPDYMPDKQQIDFLMFALVGMPIVLVTIPLVWLYLTRFAAKIPKGDFPGAKEEIASARGQLGSMKWGEITAAIAFVLAALLWIFRADMDLGAFTIPGWERLVPFSLKDVIASIWNIDPLKTLDPATIKWLALNRENGPISAWGDGLVGIGLGVLLMLIPVQRTPQLLMGLSLREASRGGWDMIILLGGGSALAFGIQETKLSTEIANLVKLSSGVSPFVALLIVCTIATVITEFASNTATANLLVPIIPAVAISLGMHPCPLMLAAALAASFGFMLPAGTPPNAICFASGYIPVTTMVRCGVLLDLFGIILVSVVCYYIAPWALGVPLLLK